MATIDNLQINVSSNVNDVTSSFDRLGNAVNNLKKGNVAIKSQTKAVNKSSSAVSKSASTWAKLGRSIGRIGFYRSIRWAIKNLSQGIKEGTDNFYEYSKTMNGSFAQSMDKAATSIAYLKNSLGTAFAPLVEMAVPYLEAAVDKFVEFINKINETVAYLRGEDYFYKATKNAKQYNTAIKEAKKSLLGFDEINRLSNDSSGESNSSLDFVPELVDKSDNSLIKKIEESGIIDSFNRFREALSNFSNSEAFKKIKEIINDLADNIVVSTLSVISNFLNIISDVLNGDLNSGLNDFKDLLVNITFDPLIGLAEIFDHIFGTNISGWLTDVKKRLEEIDVTKSEGFRKLKEAIDKAKAALDKMRDSISKFINKLDESGILDKLKIFIGWLGEVSFDITLQGIATAINAVTEAMSFFVDLFNGDFGLAFGDFADLLATLTLEPLETIASVIDSIFNTDIAGWIEGIEKAIKDFYFPEWFQTILDQSFGSIGITLRPADYTSALPKPTRSKVITREPSHFATGGFPEDGLFFANHNEIVGQFSNGKTAVANNAQIVEGISEGVYEAVTAAMNGKGDGTVCVYLDGKLIARETAKRQYQMSKALGV